MASTVRLTLTEADALILAALLAEGVPRPAAASVARALVAAEAEGQMGHGFSRVEDYVRQVRSGKIAAAAQVVLTRPATTTICVDAGHGFAYPALDCAIEAGIETARAHGTATMAVSRSHHCGALSVQVEKLAHAGLIGLMMANAPASIAPWGARQPVYGTNPIAFAAPRGTGDPLVIDLSLSRVARGKVMHAHKTGATLTEGWALDREGTPTTDPEAALAGSMVPIGQAKGTSLALMVEVLSAVLTGASLSTEASSFFSADGPPPGTGQFLLAIRPPDADGRFAARLDGLAALVEGLEGARLPGARRAAAIAAARRGGIEVPSAYVKISRAIAAGTLP